VILQYFSLNTFIVLHLYSVFNYICTQYFLYFIWLLFFSRNHFLLFFCEVFFSVLLFLLFFLLFLFDNQSFLILLQINFYIRNFWQLFISFFFFNIFWNILLNVNTRLFTDLMFVYHNVLICILLFILFGNNHNSMTTHIVFILHRHIDYKSDFICVTILCFLIKMDRLRQHIIFEVFFTSKKIRLEIFLHILKIYTASVFTTISIPHFL